MPVTLNGSTSGQVTLTATPVAGTNTVTLPASTGTALVSATSTPAQGDINYFNGTNWVSLPAGTSGQVLRTNGAAANPSWQSIGWVAVNKTTASNSASIDVTNLGAYSAIRVTISGLLPATDAVALELRFSSNNGSTYITTSTYDTANTGIVDAGTAKQTVSVDQGEIDLRIGENIGNTTADGGYSGTLLISSFNEARPTFVSGSVAYGTTQSARVAGTVGGAEGSNTAMNAFRLLMSSGNITSGSILVEGML